MVKLPSLEEYLSASQQNTTKLFKDIELKEGILETNALGLPRIRSGNFAIILKVTVDNRRFAIRCFLHMPDDVRDRYEKISGALAIDSSDNNVDYFAKFRFFSEGINVDGSWYPLIKMEWVNGLTLGEFINKNYNDKNSLLELREKLRNLQRFLSIKKISHGDIQPGNIIISNDGENLKIIDYDGMFVEGLEGKLASELGHVNFQHPKREKLNFNERLDWFAFIELDVAINYLIQNPDLWETTYSDEEGILFRSGDLRNPLISPTFYEISKTCTNLHPLKCLASICIRPFKDIPDPRYYYEENYKTIDGIEFSQATLKRKVITETKNKSQPYLSEYPIRNGNHTESLFKNIGDRIEIIGKVLDVRSGKTQFGNNRKLRPYIYLDFEELKNGKLFRIKFLPDLVEGAILSDAILPNEKWVLKWITITETIQPQNIINHPSFPDGLTEIFMIVKNLNQVKVLSESEAIYRLNSSDTMDRKPFYKNNISNKGDIGKKASNQHVIDTIKRL